MTIKGKQVDIPANRMAWIDYTKVICIFLMVCCHAGQKGLITQITYQFHMPAFFIISGLLFRPKGFKNTIISFGIPIIVFGGVHLFYQMIHILNSSGFNISVLGGGTF